MALFLLITALEVVLVQTLLSERVHTPFYSPFYGMEVHDSVSIDLGGGVEHEGSVGMNYLNYTLTKVIEFVGEVMSENPIVLIGTNMGDTVTIDSPSVIHAPVTFYAGNGNDEITLDSPVEAPTILLGYAQDVLAIAELMPPQILQRFTRQIVLLLFQCTDLGAAFMIRLYEIRLVTLLDCQGVLP
jgi:hypothetical protein